MAKHVPILESYGWKMLMAFNTAVGEVTTSSISGSCPDGQRFFEATVKWRERPEFKNSAR